MVLSGMAHYSRPLIACYAEEIGRSCSYSDRLNIVRAHGKMSLTVYGIHNYPHDFAVTKVNAPLNQCTFLLDFSRKLERQRWLFRRNKWVGITVGLLVPVVHLGERHGGFVISLSRGEPYFTDIPKLWKQHFGTSSSREIQQATVWRLWLTLASTSRTIAHSKGKMTEGTKVSDTIVSSYFHSGEDKGVRHRCLLRPMRKITRSNNLLQRTIRCAARH